MKHISDYQNSSPGPCPEGDGNARQTRPQTCSGREFKDVKRKKKEVRRVSRGAKGSGTQCQSHSPRGLRQLLGQGCRAAASSLLAALTRHSGSQQAADGSNKEPETNISTPNAKPTDSQERRSRRCNPEGHSAKGKEAFTTRSCQGPRRS